MKILEKNEKRMVIAVDAKRVWWFLFIPSVIFIIPGFIILTQLIIGSVGLNDLTAISYFCIIVAILSLIVVLFFLPIQEVITADRTAGILRSQIKLLLRKKEKTCVLSDIIKLTKDLSSVLSEQPTLECKIEAHLKNGTTMRIVTNRFLPEVIAEESIIKELAEYIGVPYENNIPTWLRISPKK